MEKQKKQYKKVVLAYSGGLDTSIIIPWLKENYGCEVVAAAGDVGQGTELDGLEAKALATGASKLYVMDLVDEFVEDYIIPTVQAGAKYEGTYLLGTSFARPPIAKKLVEIAKKEGADAICHGCTGKGNDQVRFELAIKAFAPDHEGLDLEDPANEPDYAKPGFLELGVAPEQAPDTPAYITIHFEKGKPTALDGKAMKTSTLLKELNAVGGANGIGIIDIVENRLVGMKSRGVYETPGGTILYFAHEQLEMLCLDKETAHYKALVAQKFADIVYNGQWYTPLREALSAFVDKTQENVTGDVKLKLYKGNIIPAGTTSPYSLYSEDLATFGEDSVYDQADSAGFIHLFGLPITVQAKLKEKLAAETE